MHGGDIALLILVAILGIVVCLIGVVYLVLRGMWHVVGGVVGLVRGHRIKPPPLRGARHRPCPREGCGKVDPRPALYCSQCGMRLDDAAQLDQPRKGADQ